MPDDAPETWTDYCARRSKQDPHGVSEESKAVGEATKGRWSAGMMWPDGSPLRGIIYANFGQAIKAARRFGFQLPERNVANHVRLKELREAGDPDPFAISG